MGGRRLPLPVYIGSLSASHSDQPMASFTRGGHLPAVRNKRGDAALWYCMLTQQGHSEQVGLSQLC